MLVRLIRQLIRKPRLENSSPLFLDVSRRKIGWKSSQYENVLKWQNFLWLLAPTIFVIELFRRRSNVHLDSNENGKLNQKELVYTKAVVKQHNSKQNGIWVTYKNGVYDVTNFVDHHPGGDKIFLAAGSSLEPYWSLYAVHKKDEVLEILEQMRIGSLCAEEVVKETDFADPYSTDPERHPALIVCNEKPFNAETPPELVNDHFLTPNELFFVRNHLPVPQVDIKSFKLEIGGKGMKSVSFTLDELKIKFKTVTVTATLQCAGNRRDEMNRIKMVKGLSWGSTAISNAQWTGVRLSDVLKHAGINEGLVDAQNLQHVQFEGLDNDPTNKNTFYGASIELDRAMNPVKDVILAFEMNGQPLPSDHGFPLRVIVPGVVGARNVKWLSKIVVSDEESHSHWQRRDYKSFCPSTDWDTVDFDSAPAIQEYPVQSAICVPKKGQQIQRDDGEIEVKGYAWSGGGRRIIRVDVSVDGGHSWQITNLDTGINDKMTTSGDRSWAWTLWTCQIPLKLGLQGDSVEIMCKATDVTYNGQPDSVAGVWNLRGVLNNAWHRVRVQIVD